MEERNPEVGKLRITFGENSNYSERATEIRKYSMDFEKWLLTMLVFAAGSALSFVILQALKITSSDPSYPLFLICSWLFALSLFFSFYGIAHFASGLHQRNEELNAMNNKQDNEQNVKSILKKVTEAVGTSVRFKALPLNKQYENIYDKKYILDQLSKDSKKLYFEQLEKINTIEVEIKKYNAKSNKHYKIFKIYISVSFLFFLAGIIVPLTFLSYKVVCHEG